MGSDPLALSNGTRINAELRENMDKRTKVFAFHRVLRVPHTIWKGIR